MNESIGGPKVLDAAVGTRLIERGLNLRSDLPCLWVLDRPEEIARLHEADRRAGADVVYTATFCSHPSMLDRLGRAPDFEAIQAAAVALARRTGAGWVAGSLGGFRPDEAEQAVNQAELLESLGCDAIVLETTPVSFALAFLKAARARLRLPLVVSLFEPGPIPPDAPARLEDAGADVLGTNCRSRLEEATAAAEVLRGGSHLPVWVKPGGGLPWAERISPLEVGQAARRWLEIGVDGIGGCCGTDADHVAEIRRVVDSQRLRFGLHSTPEH